MSAVSGKAQTLTVLRRLALTLALCAAVFSTAAVVQTDTATAATLSTPADGGDGGGDGGGDDGGGDDGGDNDWPRAALALGDNDWPAPPPAPGV